jgi:hypothetical protein
VHEDSSVNSLGLKNGPLINLMALRSNGMKLEHSDESSEYLSVDQLGELAMKFPSNYLSSCSTFHESSSNIQQPSSNSSQAFQGSQTRINYPSGFRAMAQEASKGPKTGSQQTVSTAEVLTGAIPSLAKTSQSMLIF